MAVCNIFSTFQNNNGTFLTFSQYLEDLTRENVEKSNYRVVPSGFYALYLDSDLTRDWDSSTLPDYLTRQFENGCAIGRNNKDTWTPQISKNLFWDAMYMITNKLEDDIEVPEPKYLKYKGTIDFHSYNEYDGMGYSEIYCYIPNDASSYDFIWEVSGDRENGLTSGETLEGYKDGIVETVYYPNASHEIIKSSKKEDNSFKINAIVPFYDIIIGDTVEYSEIPMGIYVTGLVENIDNKNVITNEVTKWVNNINIYNSGTSYGLRICSRYIATSLSDNLVPIQTNVEHEGYHELTKVLEQFSISQNKMDELLDHNYTCTQSFRDLTAIFKNSRTNVPYIKYINDEPYWFVNGKVMGMALHKDNQCDCLKLTTDWTSQNYVYNKLDDSINNIEHMYLYYTLTNNGVPVHPDELYLNGEKIDVDNPVAITFPKDDRWYHGYTLKAKYNEKEVGADEQRYINFVYPSYVGLGKELEEVITTDNIKIIESKKFEYTYSNNSEEDNHLFIIYPQSYGKLISIKDSRGLDYIDDFDFYILDETVREEKLHGINYYVYKDKNISYVTNYTLKFN